MSKILYTVSIILYIEFFLFYSSKKEMEEEKMFILSEMSQREKSLWTELLIDLVVAAYYFPKMFILMSMGDAALMSSAMGILVFKTIGFAIILGIAVAIISYLIGFSEKPEKMDERDIQFLTKGYLVGYWVLVICLCFLMGQIILSEIFQQGTHWFIIFSPVNIAHFILISLMLAGTIKAVVQLYFYRRGY